jgi:type I restriction enzyme S subunit
MPSNYKPIGDYIQLVDERNKGLKVNSLLGLSISKQFINSVANTIGTDMENYKIIRNNQFACSTMQVRRDKKMPIALYSENEPSIISQAYPIFEIINPKELLPEYLMMWFTRSEFDREACFHAVGGVRGSLEWEDFCGMKLPIPSIETQQEIVREYNVIQKRIALNNQLITKLEETAQAIYKQWFVDFETESSDKRQLDEYVDLNPTLSIKKDDLVSYVEMADLSTDGMCVSNFIKRQFTAGSKFQNNDTLLARITPCLENGKTAFVDFLNENEIAFGSTEFIVMRAKKNVSPYWVYCLARDEEFRSYAISSMVGSSGRQRVHENYLKNYLLKGLDYNEITRFHKLATPIFQMIKIKNSESQKLLTTTNLLLSKLATIENLKEIEV